ncbi:hypothetical protein TSTA_040380 [Talaromyces stipitatus ATCC 10500]|uniref:Uncharacterized protein n=1 Tax=Talaromyces stipitatus (strain ATCC 10500 / CBS 375.48 / QM 6759 / NRRL 1006) TaxID=441959 RepID=B8MI74_TALSN|nr:uncharacterized protein TSTA_040380 [Talaromyces stipitatus ATCC 10500]EED14558.1 hypothetical protein TSTA_040380 [Talaromyces stipitatus ATCC 10500]
MPFNGSGYQGYIGTFMVIPAFGKQRTECIRTEGTSTVYAAEACGIKFALERDGFQAMRTFPETKPQTGLQNVQL